MSTAIPDTTVVIPAFNGQDVVARAVESARVLPSVARVIVVDDGSTDGTADAALASGAEVFSQENAGAYAARTRGLLEVNTDFAVLLDSDDELTSGMERALELLRQDSGVAVIGGSFTGVDRSGGRERPMGLLRDGELSTQDLLAVPISPWPPAAAAVRTATLRSTLKFGAPMRTKYAEDYELLLRLSLVGRVVGISDVTCRYSIAGGKSSRAAGDALDCAIRIRDHYAQQVGVAVEAFGAADREALIVSRQVSSARLQRGAFGALYVLAGTIPRPRVFVKVMARYFERTAKSWGFTPGSGRTQ